MTTMGSNRILLQQALLYRNIIFAGPFFRGNNLPQLITVGPETAGCGKKEKSPHAIEPFIISIEVRPAFYKIIIPG